MHKKSAGHGQRTRVEEIQIDAGEDQREADRAAGQHVTAGFALLLNGNNAKPRQPVPLPPRPPGRTQLWSVTDL